MEKEKLPKWANREKETKQIEMTEFETFQNVMGIADGSGNLSPARQ